MRHYAEEWLVVRLAGMVGPGLRKNPVYDILHDLPLRIHPDSRYQFMATDDAARASLALLSGGSRRETYNVCGDGLVSPRDIAAMAGRSLNLSTAGPTMEPRVVNINLAKTSGLVPLSATEPTLRSFVEKEIAPR